MKKLTYFLATILVVLLFTNCNNYKQVAYFQNIDSISLAASKGLYDARVMPKDLLTITVSAIDPKVVYPFNMTYNFNGYGMGTSSSGTQSLIPYLVDNDGYINFPIIGKVKVAGLTKREIETSITEQVATYLAADVKPIVTVKMASFKVCVTGEVKNPGVFTVDQEKISILEAITRAGDLTIYGKRPSVLLIREQITGEKEYHRINLNDAEIFNSPYYYLQQNDIVYVEPNKIKARQATLDSSLTYWFSLSSTLLSLGTLVINLTKK